MSTQPFLCSCEGTRGLEQLLFEPDFEAALAAYLPAQRWFHGRSRTIRRAKAADVSRLGRRAAAVLVEVEYADSADVERYFLPVRFFRKRRESAAAADGLICTLAAGAGRIAIIDALLDRRATQLLAVFFFGERAVQTAGGGKLAARRTAASKGAETGCFPAVKPSSSEQSNSSVVLASKQMLKIYRRFVLGINPELEVGRYLSQETHFDGTPQTLAWLEYSDAGRNSGSAGIVIEFLDGAEDSWEHALMQLRTIFSGISGADFDAFSFEAPRSALHAADESPAMARFSRLFNGFANDMRQVGALTAALHDALAKPLDIPADFRPDAADAQYVAAAAAVVLQRADRVLTTLAGRLDALGPAHRKSALEVLDRSAAIIDLVRSISSRLERSTGERAIPRIRCHGDYHLGQLLLRGGRYYVIDFEGEPLVPLAERRKKHVPLKDAAGMLRSLSYASFSAANDVTAGNADELNLSRMYRLGTLASRVLSGLFLSSYREHLTVVQLTEEDFNGFLKLFLLDKALYELDYELRFRPDWVYIPVLGILELLEGLPD